MAAHAQTSPEENAKAVVSRFWKEVWNPPYRMETLDELVTSDFIITTDGKARTSKVGTLSKSGCKGSRRKWPT